MAWKKHARLALAITLIACAGCSLLFHDYDNRFDSNAPVATQIAAEDAGVGHLVVTNGSLFYVEGTAIKRIAVDAGAGVTPTTWAAETNSIGALAADDAGVLAWVIVSTNKSVVRLESSGAATADAQTFAIIDAAASSAALEPSTMTVGLFCDKGCPGVLAVIDRKTAAVQVFPAAGAKSVTEIVELDDSTRLGITGGFGVTYGLIGVDGGLTSCPPAVEFSGNGAYDVDFAGGNYFFTENISPVFLARVPLAADGLCPDYNSGVHIDAGTPGSYGLVAHTDDGSEIYVDNDFVVWQIQSDGGFAEVGTLPTGHAAAKASKSIAVAGRRVFVGLDDGVYALDLP